MAQLMNTCMMNAARRVSCTLCVMCATITTYPSPSFLPRSFVLRCVTRYVLVISRGGVHSGVPCCHLVRLSLESSDAIACGTAHTCVPFWRMCDISKHVVCPVQCALTGALVVFPCVTMLREQAVETLCRLDPCLALALVGPLLHTVRSCAPDLTLTTAYAEHWSSTC